VAFKCLLSGQQNYEPNQRRAALRQKRPAATDLRRDDSAMLVEFAALVLQSAGYAVNNSPSRASPQGAGRGASRPALLVTDYDMGPHAVNGLI